MPLAEMPVRYFVHGQSLNDRKPRTYAVIESVPVEIDHRDATDDPVHAHDVDCQVVDRRLYMPLLPRLGKDAAPVDLSTCAAVTECSRRIVRGEAVSAGMAAGIWYDSRHARDLKPIAIEPGMSWQAAFRTVERTNRDQALGVLAELATCTAFVGGRLHTCSVEPVVTIDRSTGPLRDVVTGARLWTSDLREQVFLDDEFAGPRVDMGPTNGMPAEHVDGDLGRVDLLYDPLPDAMVHVMRTLDAIRYKAPYSYSIVRPEIVRQANLIAVEAGTHGRWWNAEGLDIAAQAFRRLADDAERNLSPGTHGMTDLLKGVRVLARSFETRADDVREMAIGHHAPDPEDLPALTTHTGFRP